MKSLRDIAVDVGVSVSLVSKVLNGTLGTTGVRKEVAQTIRRRAVELGYRKNLSATALRSGRHNVIGVFIHGPGVSGSGITDALLEGISTSAHVTRQKLFLNFYKSFAEFRALCEVAHRGVMDGLIVGGVMHLKNVPVLARIRRMGLPVVTIWNERMHASLPNVGIDQVEVGRLATQHLIDRGCRRLVHVSDFKARYLGFRKALGANGFPYRPDDVFTVPVRIEYQYAAGELAVDTFIKRGIRFDGVVTQSDHEAMGAINALHRAGLDVPGAVRVIGVDNAPFCEFGRVPLSSVFQNFEERGRIAVNMLMEVIAGRPVQSISVEPVLVARESSR